MADVAPGEGLLNRQPVLPPCVTIRDCLEPDLASRILDFALAREREFQPATVAGQVVRPSDRNALSLGDMGPFGPLLRDWWLERLPALTEELRVSPVVDPRVGVEMAAYQNGAFFRRHIDTQVRKHLPSTPTKAQMTSFLALSAVYYVHRQPKGFSGGELRLYPIWPPQSDEFVEIEPIHNQFVVFPSWVSHEVMPVSCPSGRFEDSRFSINYFAWQRRQPSGGDDASGEIA